MPTKGGFGGFKVVNLPTRTLLPVPMAKKLKILKLANLTKQICSIDLRMKINQNVVEKSAEKCRKSGYVGD